MTHEKTQANINGLTQTLTQMFAKSPKKPRDSLETLQKKMLNAESRRVSSSLKLSDEKQILREMDSYKKQIATLKQWQIHNQEIISQKQKLNNERDSLRTITASIAELESALRKVQLAKRLNCQTCDLISHVIECPKAKIGHIIGKNGSNLRDLEKKTGCQIDVDKVGNKVHLQGSAQSLEKAIPQIENITLAIEEDLKLSLNYVGYLLSKRNTVLAKIEQAHPMVYLDLTRNSSTVSLRGRTEFVSACKMDLMTLDIKTESIPLSKQYETGIVVGKGGQTISLLSSKFDVYINVSDEPQPLIEITGKHSDVDNCSKEISQLLEDNEEIEDYILCDSIQRNLFLNNQGKVLKEIQKSFNTGGKGGVLLVFDRSENSSSEAGNDSNSTTTSTSKMIIKTQRILLDQVKDTVLSKMKEFHDSISEIQVDPAMISAIIGKNGSQIKTLRKDTPSVIIDVVRDTGLIRIQSFEEKDKETIIEAIHDIVAQNQIRQVPISQQNIIGALFGDIGKELRKKIGDEMGLWMGTDPSDQNIVLRGRDEITEQAAALLDEFMTQNYTLELDIPSPQQMEIFSSGKSQKFLNSLNKTHSVTCNLRRTRNLIQIRGLEQNVRNALEDLQCFLFGGNGKSVTQLKVPSLALGVVIGKGGSKLKEMEKKFEGIHLDVLRGSNQITLRGEQELVLKCRSYLIQMLATTKITETITTKGGEEINLRKVTEEIPGLSLTQSSNSVKIRGVPADVQDAKAFIEEILTGVFVSTIEHLSSSQLQLLDTQEIKKIAQHTNAKIEITGNSGITVTGKRAAVKKAKNQLYTLFDTLFPTQFQRVKLPKLIFQKLNQEQLAKASSSVEDVIIELDRELLSICLHAPNETQLTQAHEEKLQPILQNIEKLNAVIRLDSMENWILPRLDPQVQQLQAEFSSSSSSSLKIRTSKEALEITIQGKDESEVKKVRTQIERQLTQLRKECLYTTIPSDAISTFVGKGGSHINSFSRKYPAVKIDIIKKANRVRVLLSKGDHNYQLLDQVKQEIDGWVKDWETNNTNNKKEKASQNKKQSTPLPQAPVKKEPPVVPVKPVLSTKAVTPTTVVTPTPPPVTVEAPTSVPTPVAPTSTRVPPSVALAPSTVPSIVVKNNVSTTTNKNTKAAPTTTSNPAISQASQSLFNMLVSDDDDSSSMMNTSGMIMNGNGKNKKHAQVVPAKESVYKSIGGFKVRL
eukprot:CAMPEP_0178950558 /NCGR_PEP_ID=MMETSP0789-20121207/6725_1 /TAXON_ID=3005 /ORGANISM="Rhizosolenia setigera, Strain CCMP 1694" /LENGTH=1206 /DNA_ID=CAMNT_0020631309 /DNA_START=76 /DNA_END=3696 /DNA_ORIENTATION=-